MLNLLGFWVHSKTDVNFGVGFCFTEIYHMRGIDDWWLMSYDWFHQSVRDWWTNAELHLDSSHFCVSADTTGSTWVSDTDGLASSLKSLSPAIFYKLKSPAPLPSWPLALSDTLGFHNGASGDLWLPYLGCRDSKDICF